MRSLLVLLLLASCARGNEVELSKVEYYRDEDAGVCFAAYDLERRYGFFVAIDCTDGVMRLAKPMPKEKP